jgi:hypothetical protein
MSEKWVYEGRNSHPTGSSTNIEGYCESITYHECNHAVFKWWPSRVMHQQSLMTIYLYIQPTDLKLKICLLYQKKVNSHRMRTD